MSEDNPKLPPKPGADGPGQAPAPDAKVEARRTGRVKFDDRGNAVWEWSMATGAHEVTTERLKKLEHPALSIAEDDALAPDAAVRANPLGTKKGYDPYDSGKLGKAPAPPRKKDLRRLSEWLQLKKQAAGNKDEE